MNVFTRFILIATASLLGGCQQTVYLPGPSYPRPDGGFLIEELWAAPTNETRDRMALVGTDDPYTGVTNPTLYRTLWQSPDTDETRLVCIQAPNKLKDAFTDWEVYAYDQSNQQMMHGKVKLFTGMTPLGIVEVKIDNRIMPSFLKNKWLLGVIVSTTADDHASLDGLGIDGTPLSEEPWTRLVLVNWKIPLSVRENGYKFLNPKDISSIEYRQAEPGLTVTPDGIMKFTAD
ncbi:MAG: hypothetical protein KTR15_10940 [Phycisphaeraceae bacterium]|nr:hypothetical protein [Phycisphaeraceae bacterium]